MADIIKFQCKGCGKKMGVRPEHAGRKVRCSGCKQPLRVPSPRPRRAATGAPVASRSRSRPGISSDRGDSGISLSELAIMEQSAPAEMAEFTSRPGARAGTPRVKDGKPCPGCGTAVKQDAVICVSCGHNFVNGKKLKTKKDSKLGKAIAAASAPDDEESGGGPYKSGFTALVLIGFGVAAMVWDYNPAGSDPEGIEIAIDFMFENVGPYVTGGVLIAIGAVFGGMAVNALRD